ncbi:MAG: hypothetical protein ACRYF5_16650 [Janthinobacterium lividum]
MLAASTRIIDIKPGNRIKTVTKTATGDLSIVQHSGNVFTVSKDDADFQAFAIYSILGEL